MSTLGLRLARVPRVADPEGWARAGVSALQLPVADLHSAEASAFRQAGVRVDGVVTATPPPVASLDSLCDCVFDPHALPESTSTRRDWVAILTGFPRDSRLLAHAGVRVGRAVLSPLDGFAAALQLDGEAARQSVAERGGDADRAAAAVDRYLHARESGSAPAALSVDADSIALLLGDDTAAVMGARADAVLAEVGAMRPLLTNAGAVAIEVDARSASFDDVVRSTSRELDRVLVRVSVRSLGQLLQIGRRGVEAGASGIVLDFPSTLLPSTERLADALDICEGLAADEVILEMTTAAAALGPASVARAAHRLRGRSWDLGDQQDRRRETVAP